MMWRSKKKTAEDEENAKATEKDNKTWWEEESERKAEPEAPAEEKESFVESLWRRKGHKEEQKDEAPSEKEIVETREQSESKKKPGDAEAGEEEYGKNGAWWKESATEGAEEGETKPSFIKSLWRHKSHKEGQGDKDLSEKGGSETGELSEPSNVEGGTAGDQTSERDKEATENTADPETKAEGKPSFIKSLWRRKSYKEDQKEEEANAASHDKPGDKDGDAADEEEPPQKPRWSSLWGGKKDEEEEAVEVEVTPDSSLRIHASSRNFNKSASWYNPNRPSVHEEALEMLTGSLLIYIFADLREMARDGTIDAPELLEDPTPIRKVLEAIKDHKEALEQRAIDHDDLQGRLYALKAAHAQANTPEGSTAATTMVGQILRGGPDAASALDAQEPVHKSKESALVQFEDEKSTQGAVYGIALNHQRKRVTVVFRGSVTQQDFLTDSRSAQKKIDNPVATLIENAPEHIQIHTGFYKYLFAKDKENPEKRRWMIILEDAKRLMKENTGYRLYITGHSLGGALSTLCGFYAAMDDELVENGPVCVISIASPQVGHHTFCESFHALECLGRLQHLRVANKEDMITHLPFVHIKAHVLSPVAVAMFGAGNVYKHCGIQLELKSVEEENEKKTEHFVRHAKGLSAEAATHFYSEEFIRAAKLLYEAVVPLGKGDVDALTMYHSCTEYEARLMASQEYLSGVTIDELYLDEGIVGAALAKNVSQCRLPEE